jgi:hypothetical protein
MANLILRSARSPFAGCYDSRRMLLNHLSIMISSSENVPRRLLIVAAAGCACVQCVSSASGQINVKRNQLPSVATVHVDANPKHVLNSFDPDRALGSSLDVLSRAGIDKVHSPHIVQESLSQAGDRYLPQQYRTADGRVALTKTADG